MREMYSPTLLDHFEHPRNAGELASADATAQVENPACGDVLKLSMKVDGEQIADIRFLAKGCVPAMACASALTTLVKGQSVSHARGLSREEIIEAVGGVPPASSHAGHLAIETLQALLNHWERASR